MLYAIIVTLIAVATATRNARERGKAYGER
jgi:hypothetical protein